MDQAAVSLVGMGLPGVVILGLSVAVWKVHGLYVKAQDARISEGLASLEKVMQAIAILDKVR